MTADKTPSLPPDLERLVAALERRAKVGSGDEAPGAAARAIRRLATALAPLAKIAQVWSENGLDEDRPEFSARRPDRAQAPKDVQLFAGRGGRQLLTLADCLAAKEAIELDPTGLRADKETEPAVIRSGGTASAYLHSGEEFPIVVHLAVVPEAEADSPDVRMSLGEIGLEDHPLKRRWAPGDPYCGTAQEAIDFALDPELDWGADEKTEFLRLWREGALEDYPEFTFAPETLIESAQIDPLTYPGEARIREVCAWPGISTYDAIVTVRDETVAAILPELIRLRELFARAKSEPEMRGAQYRNLLAERDEVSDLLNAIADELQRRAGNHETHKVVDALRAVASRRSK